MTDLFDTIILGGGPAGLTAAIYAGRARRMRGTRSRIIHCGTQGE